MDVFISLVNEIDCTKKVLRKVFQGPIFDIQM